MPIEKLDMKSLISNPRLEDVISYCFVENKINEIIEGFEQLHKNYVELEERFTKLVEIVQDDSPKIFDIMSSLSAQRIRMMALEVWKDDHEKLTLPRFKKELIELFQDEEVSQALAEAIDRETPVNIPRVSGGLDDRLVDDNKMVPIDKTVQAQLSYPKLKQAEKELCEVIERNLLPYAATETSAWFANSVIKDICYKLAKWKELL